MLLLPDDIQVLCLNRRPHIHVEYMALFKWIEQVYILEFHFSKAHAAEGVSEENKRISLTIFRRHHNFFHKPLKGFCSVFPARDTSMLDAHLIFSIIFWFRFLYRLEVCDSSLA